MNYLSANRKIKSRRNDDKLAKTYGVICAICREYFSVISITLKTRIDFESTEIAVLPHECHQKQGTE
jgi:hypothetical protein